ncbi:MAG: hypothetical protein HUU06_13285, partial [Planctomycetaceae bacterium]|nr:hypothetical protein [Planctomycetaceae bacterium]
MTKWLSRAATLAVLAAAAWTCSPLGGDDDPLDGTGKGFDSILDNPNVAGGAGSFWGRQSLRLLGTNLVQRLSFYPNLRTAKAEGEANFVNPGLLLWN